MLKARLARRVGVVRVLGSTSWLPAPRSPRVPPTRTWPSGPTTSCTLAPPTPTPSPSWLPATAAPSRRPSVDVELVALGVPHGDPVVVDAVLADDPDQGGAERFQPLRLGVDEPAPGLDRIRSPAA